jgi:hypothetical protein
MVRPSDQLDFYGLLDRQIGWFLAFENTHANLVRRIADAAAIGHQAAGCPHPAKGDIRAVNRYAAFDPTGLPESG